MITINQEEKIPAGRHIFYLILRSLLLLIIPYLFFSMFKFQGIITFIFIFIVLPVTIYSYLYDNSIIFIVGDDKITIKEGIFFKKTKIIPYSSVQSVDIKSGMLKSWMQLRVVNIWTGSQEQVGVKEISPDGALMLSAEDAEWLASHIVSNKNR